MHYLISIFLFRSHTNRSLTYTHSLTHPPTRTTGQLPLASLPALVGPVAAQGLRAAAGGVKTLLRNHWQLFVVQGPCVSLRDWRDLSINPPNMPAASRKTKPCWFHDHHPDGCPRAAADCPFAHGPDDHKPQS
eukprot:m.105891 g.105891  ORF g.105891 m.105891 type:complete len:133 (+) comp14212_c3_seq1:1416-1814(+)